MLDLNCIYQSSISFANANLCRVPASGLEPNVGHLLKHPVHQDTGLLGVGHMSFRCGCCLLESCCQGSLHARGHQFLGPSAVSLVGLMLLPLLDASETRPQRLAATVI